MPLSGPPDLTELLAALRADGIPVGPAELTRLHHAFQGAPRLDREGLRPFLACLLAKTPEQRTLFDQRFDIWCPDLPAEWEAEPQVPPACSNVPRAAEQTARAEPEPFERPEPVAPPRRWLPVALLLTAVLAYLLWQPTRGPVRVEEPAGKAVTLPEVPDTGHALPANPAPPVWYWRVKILAVEVPSRLAAEELALIALLAGLLAGWLWWRYRRQTPPPPRLPPTYGGPNWLPLPPSLAATPACSTPGSAAVWSGASGASPPRTSPATWNHLCGEGTSPACCASSGPGPTWPWWTSAPPGACPASCGPMACASSAPGTWPVGSAAGRGWSGPPPARRCRGTCACGPPPAVSGRTRPTPPRPSACASAWDWRWMPGPSATSSGTRASPPCAGPSPAAAPSSTGSCARGRWTGAASRRKAAPPPWPSAGGGSATGTRPGSRAPERTACCPGPEPVPSGAGPWRTPCLPSASSPSGPPGACLP